MLYVIIYFYADLHSKVKLSLCFKHHAMKALHRRGGKAPHILNLSTIWR